MTQTGFYGQAVTQYFHLEHQASSLITRSLRNAEIAVTEVRDDTPLEGPSGEMDIQDAYVVSLKLRRQDRYSCGRNTLVRREEKSTFHHQQAVTSPPFLSSAHGAGRHR